MEIWSGGQTGVDRAALDAARDLGMTTGGWVPLGRLDENGCIPPEYNNLREADTADWSQRTLLNVRDTDATLVLTWGEPAGGTQETIEFATRESKPCFTIDLERQERRAAARAISSWLSSLAPVARLNVAGPRASKAPAAYGLAREILRMALWTEMPPHEGANLDYVEHWQAPAGSPVEPDESQDREPADRVLAALSRLLDPPDSSAEHSADRALAELNRLLELPELADRPRLRRREPVDRIATRLEGMLRESDRLAARVKADADQPTGDAAIDAFIEVLDQEAGRLDDAFRTALPESLKGAAAHPDRLARLISLMQQELRQYETLAGQARGRMFAALRRAEEAARCGEHESARRALDEYQAVHTDAERAENDAAMLRELLEAYQATDDRGRSGT